MIMMIINDDESIIKENDETHGFVIDKGAGIVKHLNLQDKIDFQIGTLSKAIDVVGDYVARTKKC
ncbi:2-amino-3-ketobutyrate CoA ligase [Staphylococcus hominis]|nr:hypothetical protein [Staphylococcus hominis]UNQ67899.1 hypothetical protein MOV58_11085 [Staphylococcus hominis]SUM40357.1 2-amino-3-ketobutyrate CoA ligase [Staphylococcus hominis]